MASLCLSFTSLVSCKFTNIFHILLILHNHTPPGPVSSRAAPDPSHHPLTTLRTAHHCRPAQLSPSRLGAISSRHGSAHLGTAQLISARLSSSRRGSAHLGTAQLISARLSSSRRGSAHLGTAQLISSRLSSSRHTSAHLGAAQLISARLSSSRHGSAHLGAASRREQHRKKPTSLSARAARSGDVRASRATRRRRTHREPGRANRNRPVRGSPVPNPTRTRPGPARLGPARLGSARLGSARLGQDENRASVMAAHGGRSRRFG